MLGTERKTDEPYGIAIRTYVESPRHADEYLEASLAMRDSNGTQYLATVDVPNRKWNSQSWRGSSFNNERFPEA